MTDINELLDRVAEVLRWAARNENDRCRYCAEPHDGGHAADCWVGEALAALSTLRSEVEGLQERCNQRRLYIKKLEAELKLLRFAEPKEYANAKRGEARIKELEAKLTPLTDRREPRSGCRLCIFGGARGEHDDPCSLHVCSECMPPDQEKAV